MSSLRLRPVSSSSFAAPLALVLALAGLAACAPGSCQGATESPLSQNAVDKPKPVLKCKGAAIDVQGDVDIRSQLELDELQGCKRIFGAVIVHDSNDIVDLAPLAGIEEINEGYFLALNNEKLASVEMPSLKKVDYGVGVIDNPNVTSVTFDELGNADSEGITKGDVTLRGNPLLSSAQFPNVQEIRTDDRGGPGSLILGDNPKLATLSGFGKLERIEGVLQIFNEDALTNLGGLEQLNEIANTGNAQQALAIGIDFDQNFEIIDAGNDLLSSLTGLDDLELVADASGKGDIFIGFNPSLLDLQGLEDLAVFKHDMFIVGNASLNNLSGLEGDEDGNGEDDGLSVVNGSLFIGLFFDRFKQPVAAGNDQLEDLAGLNSLLQLDGSLVLAFNGELANLDGLDQLATVGKDFVLVGSRQLDDFQGAEALTTINGSLVFGQLFSNTDRVIGIGDQDDELEPELDEMGDVNKVPLKNAQDFGCAIDLGNDFVADDRGFPVLATIGKDLVVASSDFDTLFLAQNLTSIAGNLVLHSSGQPADFTGLESVASIGGLVVGLSVDKKGNVAPAGNGNFEAFTGLTITDLGAGGLTVGFNDQLNSFATLPALGNVVGNVTLVATDVTTLADVNITTIGGDLRIGAIVNGDAAPIDAAIPDLTDVVMDELTNVGGDVLIAFEQDLDATTFAALATVTGSLEITACNNLDAISGLEALTTAGSVLIHDLTALTVLDLSQLGSTTGDIRIVNDENLTNIQLDALTSVGGTLELRALPVDNLNTLAALASVGDLANAVGDLAVVDLVDLNNTAGFANLGNVGGSFFLLRAETIEDTAFPLLTQVGASLEIVGLEQVEDLEGMETLQTVGDGLRIRDNQNLVTLKGLEGLLFVGRELSLVNNPELDIVVRDEDQPDQLDNVDDQGLVFLTQIGNPDFEGVGGDRGVIEAKLNPKMLEEDLVTIAEDFADQFEGFFKFCGNQDSGENTDIPSTVDCPDLDL